MVPSYAQGSSEKSLSKAMAFFFYFLLLPSAALGNKCLEYPLIRGDSNQTTQVHLTFRVYFVDHFDDVNGILAIRASLILTWHDPCPWKTFKSPDELKRFPNGSISLERTKVWIPTIIQENSLDETLATDGASELPLTVYPDHSNELWLRKVWQNKCFDIHLAKFPFDSNVCHLTFNIWATDGAATIETGRIDFSSTGYRKSENQQFDFEFHQPTMRKKPYNCQTTSEICYASAVDFPVTIHRRWYPYYFFGIFIPLFTISILQLSAFVIPYDLIERPGYSVTLFVASAVTGTEVQRYVPETSEFIPVLAAANVSSIGSMSATFYFCIIFALKRHKVGTKQHLQIVDGIFFAIFIIFYIALYSITLVIIITPKVVD